MKSIINFITVLVTIITFCHITGCKCVCPVDEPLRDFWKTFIPYQQGDKIAFANNNKDTIWFTCTDRWISNYSIDLDMAQADCCSPGVGEDLQCTLSSDNGDLLTFKSIMQHVLSIKIQIDTIDMLFYSTNYERFDSILIGNKIFYDVVIYKNNNDLNSYICYHKEGSGLLVFVLGGIEWVLIE